MKFISLIVLCAIGCSPVASQKPAHESRVVEHTVANGNNGRMIVCTMRCENDTCSVVECGR